MNLLQHFLPRTQFNDYNDFYQNFQILPPPHFNFAYDVVDAYAAAAPDQLALLWADDDGSLSTFTFADIKKGSDKAALVFAAHGIRKGDPVLLALKNRFEFWFCILALHKLGAIAIPATHMLTDHDLLYRFRAASVKMAVIAPDPCLADYCDAACTAIPNPPLRAIVRDARPGWINFTAEWTAANPANFRPPSGPDAPSPSDPMLIYFSSGTSGEPKMVLHDFLYPLGHIPTSHYWHHDTDGGLHYTVADTGWGKAVWGNLYGQWISGSAIFVHDYQRFHPDQTLALSTRVGVTSFCAPPTVYRFLIKSDLSPYNFSSLKSASVAGEPLNPEVYQRFYQATGLRLMEAYGQTETTCAIANFLWMNPKPGSMGRPSPLFKIRLVRPDGSPCDVGEHGEMVVPIPTHAPRPYGLFREYYRDPIATAHAHRGGLYHTGDVAWTDEDGYFWYVGRDDDLIKSSGYRIGPFEVESALMEHPAVLECAVTALPDPDRGQIVKATIVLTPDYTPRLASPDQQAALTRELQNYVKHATAPYKYPRHIEYVPELPKTISGKIRRKAIRLRDAAG